MNSPQVNQNFYLRHKRMIDFGVIVIILPILILAIGGHFVNELMRKRRTDGWFDMQENGTNSLVELQSHCGTTQFSPGEKPKKSSRRIDADLGEFPWLVLVATRHQGKVHACGGSIIHYQYVLTAAHCCLNYTLSRGNAQILVRVGEYHLKTNPDQVKGRQAPEVVDIFAEDVYIQPQFNQSSLLHDLCLVKLERKINFTEYVYPICLPTHYNMQREYFNDSVLTGAGWGQGFEGVQSPHNVVQKVNVATGPIDACVEMTHFKHVLSEPPVATTLCAISEAGHTMCKGDSGGPLMHQFSGTGVKRTYVVGVVSSGDPCYVQNQKTHTFFIRVAPYLKWIFDTITHP